MSSREQPSDRREGRRLHTGALRVRPTVGLIVLDNTQRVLLFNIQDTFAIDIAHPDLTLWWGPPGGGVESAETFEQAGVRELWEETGLTVTHLGPHVWTYERTIKFPDEVVLFHIRYFVVNVSASEVDISNLLENERAIYRDHRWCGSDGRQTSAVDAAGLFLCDTLGNPASDHRHGIEEASKNSLLIRLIA